MATTSPSILRTLGNTSACMGLVMLQHDRWQGDTGHQAGRKTSACMDGLSMLPFRILHRTHNP